MGTVTVLFCGAVSVVPAAALKVTIGVAARAEGTKKSADKNIEDETKATAVNSTGKQIRFFIRRKHSRFAMPAYPFSTCQHKHHRRRGGNKTNQYQAKHRLSSHISNDFNTLA